MYTRLLKQHEEILKKLTDKASKETDFGERGQFINIQKMINNELYTIADLNRIHKEKDSDKLCAYKLGVGKILIGQRGSGISSTLIDECLKYNRPLIVESKHRAENLVKQYPNLMVAYFIKDFTKNCLELMNVNKEIVNLNDAQVNVDLNTSNSINKDMTKKINEIKSLVGVIGTVGISYEIEEQYPIWFSRSAEASNVEINETKPNKYVYAFEGNEGCMDLIYFDDFDGKDSITISNVRHTSKLIEVKEALFLANSMGYKLIIDCSAFGRNSIESIKLIDDSIEITEVRCTCELNSNAWSTYSKIKNSPILQSNDDLGKIALEAFDEINIDLSKGYVKWSLDRSDGRESLLRAILIAYHTIVGLNKQI